MDILFLSGHTYYNKIKTKGQGQTSWYEKLYILYYENFKTILLILACIILYNFINIQHCSNNKGKRKGYGKCNEKTKELTGGKFNYGKGVISKTSSFTKKTMLSKTEKNIEKTKSAFSAPFKKESYKKLGSNIKSGVESGYARGKELGSAGLEYGSEQLREKSEFIYKYIALIFIGIGFSVYIFPVLAMFLIGALTFLIVRKSIAGVITM
jgi:hypothetical protein